VPSAHAREAVVQALHAGTPDDVVRILTRGLAEWLDLSLFSGRWNLSTDV
jgi:hypothetical protein